MLVSNSSSSGTRHSVNSKRSLVLLGTFWLIACGTGSNDDTDADPTNGSGAESETTESGAGPDTETGSGTETGPDTGSEGDLCDQSCAVAAECGGEVTLDECIEECQQLLGDLEDVPECIPPNEAMLECIAGLDCAEFMAYLEGGPEAPCSAQEDALDECGDPGCILTIEGNENGCLAEYHCSGSEDYHAVQCSFADGCVCRLNGEDVGSCMNAEPVCASDFDQQVPAINDCCGWMLEP